MVHVVFKKFILQSSSSVRDKDRGPKGNPCRSTTHGGAINTTNLETTEAQCRCRTRGPIRNVRVSEEAAPHPNECYRKGSSYSSWGSSRVELCIPTNGFEKQKHEIYVRYAIPCARHQTKDTVHYLCDPKILDSSSGEEARHCERLGPNVQPLP